MVGRPFARPRRAAGVHGKPSTKRAFPELSFQLSLCSPGAVATWSLSCGARRGSRAAAFSQSLNLTSQNARFDSWEKGLSFTLPEPLVFQPCLPKGAGCESPAGMPLPLKPSRSRRCRLPSPFLPKHLEAREAAGDKERPRTPWRRCCTSDYWRPSGRVEAVHTVPPSHSGTPRERKSPFQKDGRFWGASVPYVPGRLQPKSKKKTRLHVAVCSGSCKPDWLLWALSSAARDCTKRVARDVPKTGRLSEH